MANSAPRPVEGSEAHDRLILAKALLADGNEDGALAESTAAQIFVRMLRKDPENREARERLDETLRARTQRRKG